MAKSYAHLASRLFGTPLAIEAGALDIVLSVLSGRLGIEAPLASFEIDEAPEREPVTTAGGIAVIPITGKLVNRGGVDAMSGMVSYEQIATDLAAAIADPKVSGILLDIDSPGGEVSGLFDLVDRIVAADEIKPVIAAVNDAAFSAAFAIASAARKVFTTKTGGVGSIGVVAVHVDQSEADAQAGLKVEHITFGARKAEGNPHEPLSDDARSTIQAEVDRVGEMFVATVASNRGLDMDTVRGTEAGVFFGHSGVDAGLADSLGGKEAALAELTGVIQQEKQRMDFEAQIAALQAELEIEKARASAYEEAALESRQNEITSYVDQLQAKATEAQAPIPAEKIAAVAGLFSQGQDDTARLLGSSLLDAALARGAGEFKRVDEEKPKALTPEQEAAKRMEALGYTVTLNSDGTKIVTATKG